MEDRTGYRHGPEHYTIGLFGDMPYGALGRSQYPNLLADINHSHVAFSIFDGDLQAGGDGPCNDSLYTTSLANFNRLERPLIWVPGDNDWTDCWGRYGAAQAPYHDPIERLNFERQLFDSTSQSLGQRTLTLTRESSEGGQYAIYSENVRWVYGPVVYIGLNVQGSNDNYPYPETDGESGAVITRSDAEIQRERNEETARKAADLHWLDESFAYAKQVGAKGILIDWQADPNFNNEQHLSNPHDWDAFPDYVNALAQRDDELPRPGRAGPRRLALLQDGQADQPAQRRRACQLHPRRDVRRPPDPLGQRHDRPPRPEPVRVRTAHRPSQRRLVT